MPKNIALAAAGKVPAMRFSASAMTAGWRPCGKACRPSSSKRRHNPSRRVRPFAGPGRAGKPRRRAGTCRPRQRPRTRPGRRRAASTATGPPSGFPKMMTFFAFSASTTALTSAPNSGRPHFVRSAPDSPWPARSRAIVLCSAPNSFSWPSQKPRLARPPWTKTRAGSPARDRIDDLDTVRGPAGLPYDLTVFEPPPHAAAADAASKAMKPRVLPKPCVVAILTSPRAGSSTGRIVMEHARLHQRIVAGRN